MNKEYLENLYINKKLSTYKIAKLLKCDPKTVYWRLKNLKIPIRSRKVVPILKKELQMLYLKHKFSLKEIGERYGIVPAAVFRKMNAFGIPLRNSWDHITLKEKTPFTGSLEEKAYLVGFRIGDLNIYQTTHTTHLIRVGCNTTKLEQVNLINMMFSKYAHVSISRTKDMGVVSINTLLDRSFSFLIPKVDIIERWIQNDKKCMKAFIAGYIDAEGSMGIYNQRARFRLGSYDIGILKSIQEFFINLELKSYLNLERRRGSINAGGFRLNGDFWRIVIDDKKSILAIINLLLPYMKHQKRRLDFERARSNVFRRGV